MKWTRNRSVCTLILGLLILNSSCSKDENSSEKDDPTGKTEVRLNIQEIKQMASSQTSGENIFKLQIFNHNTEDVVYNNSWKIESTLDNEELSFYIDPGSYDIEAEYECNNLNLGESFFVRKSNDSLDPIETSFTKSTKLNAVVPDIGEDRLIFFNPLTVPDVESMETAIELERHVGSIKVNSNLEVNPSSEQENYKVYYHLENIRNVSFNIFNKTFDNASLANGVSYDDCYIHPIDNTDYISQSNILLLPNTELKLYYDVVNTQNNQMVVKHKLAKENISIKQDVRTTIDSDVKIDATDKKQIEISLNITIKAKEWTEEHQETEIDVNDN